MAEIVQTLRSLSVGCDRDGVLSASPHLSLTLSAPRGREGDSDENLLRM
jgi:hypothetical protein